jgi:hypothetical protein
MSSPQIRRADRLMSHQRTLETMTQGYSGRLATVSEDGFPYCIPLLYLWINGEVYLQTTSAGGHLRARLIETVGDGVRFTPNSGHGAAPQQLTRCARSGSRCISVSGQSRSTCLAALWSGDGRIGWSGD